MSVVFDSYGTLQHEIFTGEAPIVWNDDDLIIKVNCKEDAGGTRSPVPYCLFVTFEVAAGYAIDLYTSVSTKIRQRVQIQFSLGIIKETSRY